MEDGSDQLARTGRRGIVAGLADRGGVHAPHRAAAGRRHTQRRTRRRSCRTIDAAVCRVAGFVEENLIGHSTHGSSKKQKDPVQARHASLPLGAAATRGVDRREERRDPFAPSDFPRGILSRPQGAADQGGRARRPKNKLQLAGGGSRAARAFLTHRVCAAPYCHRRHERRPRPVGFRAGGGGGGTRVHRCALHPDRAPGRPGARTGRHAALPMCPACSPPTWSR